MFVILIFCYCEKIGGAPSDMQKQAAIEYKMQSPEVRDELGLLNKEIVDEVQEWNMYVANYQAKEKNFWIGIFYPNLSDKYDYHIINYN